MNKKINSILFLIISGIQLVFANALIANAEFINVYPLNPISRKRILPNTDPIPALVQNQIEMKACRKEFKPASFVIRAKKALTDVRITITDFSSTKKVKLPSSILDIKLVKCWYQSGENTIENKKKKVLVPELLLNDSSLIKVDYDKKINYIKVFDNCNDRMGKYIDISSQDEAFPKNVVIKDSDTLKSFNMDADTNIQIWLTIHVPEDTESGLYSGTIDIRSNEGVSSQVFLLLTVLPFDLDEPLLEYGLYYTGKLTSTTQKEINSEWKDIDQYSIELQNIFNHGVSFPTLYQELKSNQVHNALKIREALGFPVEHLYVYGTRTDDVDNPKIKNQVLKQVASWMEIASQYSYSNVYFYGRDEAVGKKLKAQRQTWEEIHLMGAKVFAACSGGAVDIVGDILDKPILAGNYNFRKKDLQKWISKGKSVLSYDNPQVVIENPEIYRLNYGFKLLSEGYAGAMPFAYQHSFGHIWNDYDHKKFRDHVFAYPTSAGVIDTIQWEGFREAVNDIRYISTFINKNEGRKNDILKWLRKELKNKTDLSEIRNKIIEKIKSIN